ncbi:MAG: PIN domain-containing protein [Eubacteriales bacterium]|jgi:hypothetical protein
MGKKAFLVDYENVALHGLYGISAVEPGSKVVIFGSGENIIRSLRDILDAYRDRDITVETRYLDHKGNNALDFMLVTYMGYLTADHSVSEIYIISNDRGYEAAIKSVKELNSEVIIKCGECIAQCLAKSRVVLENRGEDRPQREKNKPSKEKKKTLTDKEKKEIILNRMCREKRIKEKYCVQLASLMRKSKNRADYSERIKGVLGGKNSHQEALEYYDEFLRL